MRNPQLPENLGKVHKNEAPPVGAQSCSPISNPQIQTHLFMLFTPNSHFLGVGGGLQTNFQLLMPSPNLCGGGRGMGRGEGDGDGEGVLGTNANFWCQVQIC